MDTFDTFRDRLGGRIQELRRARGIRNQAALGELAGLSRTYVGYIEQGSKSASLESLHAIAGALGVEVRDLFDFEGRSQNSNS